MSDHPNALPPLTDSGFLVNTADWNEQVAQALAERCAITLSEQHWEIIRFIRDYYRSYNHLPNARMFLKAAQKQLGEEKGNSDRKSTRLNSSHT